MANLRILIVWFDHTCGLSSAAQWECAATSCEAHLVDGSLRVISLACLGCMLNQHLVSYSGQLIKFILVAVRNALDLLMSPDACSQILSSSILALHLLIF